MKARFIRNLLKPATRTTDRKRRRWHDSIAAILGQRRSWIGRLGRAATLACAVWLMPGCGHPTKSSSIPASDRTELRFSVQGMRCAGCAGGLRSELLRTPGVQQANVNLKHQQAVVTCDPSQVGAEQLIEVIREAGFQARQVAR